MNAATLLSLIIFTPTIAAVFLLFFSKQNVEAMRYFAFLATAVTLGLTLLLLPDFKPSSAEIQYAVNVPWIQSWNVNYQLGIDGISLPLVLLTGLITMLAMMASWNIEKEVKGYLILFLLLETGMMGVFIALDFFLFYVFWEVMLLPMYFLIGIWGGPRREYAAIKFFLYTLFGGVLMLVALLMFYFSSTPENPSAVRAHVAELERKQTANELSEAEAASLPALKSLYNVQNKDISYSRGTFDILQLQAIGQGKMAPFLSFGRTMQIVAFILLFIGFAIKVPVFPFHTWLPDAHVEAPTPISMILAGVLLKMGGYGLLRIAFPICPLGAQFCAYGMVLLGVISIIYGAFAAMAQTDFKRLVAYSSVSHMGYVLLGIAVWKLNESGATVGKDYWVMGLNGAMFQMIAHGISSAGMFFMVGVIYDRVHHRDLNQFGGLIGLMPLYGGLAVGLFFAGLGLPGLCGFIGEIFTVLSAWNYSRLLAVISAAGVILTAGYILWAVQRVYLGPVYKGPHPEAITPMNEREAAIGYILLAFAIALGVYPEMIFVLMRSSLDSLATNLDLAMSQLPDAVKVVGK